LALVAIEGQIVQPLLVGRRLRLNPMLVFLALWFGGFFWGIAGVVLATPTLATLKVIAENSAHGRQLLDFLSPQGDTGPSVRAPVTGRAAKMNPKSKAGSGAAAAIPT
jgi:predicted PurR-regulated permease PerM